MHPKSSPTAPAPVVLTGSQLTVMDGAALGEEGRWRCFSREQISKRDENLDISWLRDESLRSRKDLPEPGVIATEIMEKLRVATVEMEALMVLLEGEEAAEAAIAAVGLLPLE